MHNLVMSEDDMQYIILLWKFTKKLSNDKRDNILSSSNINLIIDNLNLC